MNAAELAEYTILRMAGEEGKFALEVGTAMGGLELQEALQRLQIRGWIRLLDISPVAASPGKMFRIFLATEEARAWLQARN